MPRRWRCPNARRRRRSSGVASMPSVAASAPPADMPATNMRRGCARKARRTARTCASDDRRLTIAGAGARVEPVPAAPRVGLVGLARQQHEPAVPVGERGDARAGRDLLRGLLAAVQQHDQSDVASSANTRAGRRRGIRARATPTESRRASPCHENLLPATKRPGAGSARPNSRARNLRTRSQTEGADTDSQALQEPSRARAERGASRRGTGVYKIVHEDSESANNKSYARRSRLSNGFQIRTMSYCSCV